MNEQERLALMERYLDELDRELKDVPESQRLELVEDVRTHIEDAWAESETRTRADFLNILLRLGDPKAVAREEMDRLGIPTAQPSGPGLLEVAAIVGTVLFWPVGVLLAWLSPRWYARDKAVATALPILGLVLLFAASMPASVAYSQVYSSTQQVVVSPMPATSGPTEIGPDRSQPATPRPAPESPQPLFPAALALFSRVLVLFGFVGAPLFSAIYLALRMRPRPHRAAVLIPVAAAALLVLATLGAFLAPMAR